MFRRFWPALPCLLLTLAACSEHDTPLVPPDPAVAIAPPAIGKARLPQMERLARRFALALRDPQFRSYVYRRLNGSPYREHKLPFRRFLGEEGGSGLHALAAGRREAEDSIGKEAEGASALEFYFPVPAHRSRWAGDENILVATAWADRDAPVAFDTRGQRSLLSPDRPPDTPVLALVPVEQDFDSPAALARPAGTQCVEPCVPTSGGSDGGSGNGGNPGGPSTAPPAAGVYLLKAHFNSTFEGWLKGDPEFEFHVHPGHAHGVRRGVGRPRAPPKTTQSPMKSPMNFGRGCRTAAAPRFHGTISRRWRAREPPPHLRRRRSRPAAPRPRGVAPRQRSRAAEQCRGDRRR